MAKPKKQSYWGRQHRELNTGALKRRVEEVAGHPVTILTTTPGEVKMSEVLSEFIEPYAPSAKTEKTFRTLVSMAVIAWNAALMPESERWGPLESTLAEHLPEDEAAQARILIGAMIARKEAHFPHIRRLIAGAEVQMTPGGLKILVASVPEPGAK